MIADLWVDIKEAPVGCVPLFSCAAETVEDVEPVLMVTVWAAARRLCSHSGDWRLPCGSCSLLLLHLCELIRGSSGWALHAGHFVAQVAYAERVLHSAAVEQTRGLSGRYDGQEWPLDYLAVELAGLELSIDQARQVIVEALSQALPWEVVLPRDAESRPSRHGVHRGELEIAARQGWDQPQRWQVEERVRAAAVVAMNEAHFILSCVGAGVSLIPKVGAPHPDVAGYTASLTAMDADLRREFAGRSLAVDLTLHALRQAWAQSTDARPASATWLMLCSDLAALPGVPSERADGRWPWILPHLVPTTSLVGELPANPTYGQVRAYLIDRQGDGCAMCQIQRRGWEATRGTPIPAGLIGPADHMDHNHDTGLVRGMLCARCNTMLEPAGQVSRDEVWLAYTQNPPIGDHTVMWRPSSGSAERR